MTNFDKNERRMTYLTKEAKAHPETWVEDVIDSFTFEVSKDDPNYQEKLDKFKFIMDFKIDWYHPSKDRLYAYDLENNTFIYLDREMFLTYMRPYWREKKAEQRHRNITVSLDTLHDEYELELDNKGRLITKDNYYQFDYDDGIDEEDAKDYLTQKLDEALKTMKPFYKELVDLLKSGLKVGEIASKLGIPQSTVSHRIERIKKVLKKFR